MDAKRSEKYRSRIEMGREARRSTGKLRGDTGQLGSRFLQLSGDP